MLPLEHHDERTRTGAALSLTRSYMLYFPAIEKRKRKKHKRRHFVKLILLFSWHFLGYDYIKL
jgi:hypothetical protein